MNDSVGFSGEARSAFEVGHPEGFAERLDRLGCRLAEIDKRWNDRLVFDALVFREDYFKARFAFVFELSLRTNNGCVRVYVSSHFRSDDHIPEIIPQRGDGQIPCGDREQVVLVPIAQVIEDADCPVPASGKIAMGFYSVPEQELGLFDGGTYRSLFNGGYQTLPIVRDRQCLSFHLKGIAGPNKPHPGIVEGGAEVTADIPGQETDTAIHRPVHTRMEAVAAACRVRFVGDGVRFSIDERFAEYIEVLDVMLGPFNL
ncbi:hypothetical protein [Qipengyuania flava]|uniref:hypothetical protein n=1 Tax=Qipengyuania flava TaxID=192812 RepID=UPI003BAF9BCE